MNFEINKLYVNKMNDIQIASIKHFPLSYDYKKNFEIKNFQKFFL